MRFLGGWVKSARTTNRDRAYVLCPRPRGEVWARQVHLSSLQSNVPPVSGGTLFFGDSALCGTRRSAGVWAMRIARVPQPPVTITDRIVAHAGVPRQGGCPVATNKSPVERAPRLGRADDRARSGRCRDHRGVPEDGVATGRCPLAVRPLRAVPVRACRAVSPGRVRSSHAESTRPASESTGVNCAPRWPVDGRGGVRGPILCDGRFVRIVRGQFGVIGATGSGCAGSSRRMCKKYAFNSRSIRYPWSAP